MTVTVTDGVMTTSKTLTLTVNDTILDTDGDGFPDEATGIYPADNCRTVFNPASDWVDKNNVSHTGTQANFDLDTPPLGDLCDTPEKGGDSPLGSAFDGKVLTSQAMVTPPTNGSSYQAGESIFVTVRVTFQRVDRDGDGTFDKYFAFRPDPFNVFVKVENNGVEEAAHRILEAPMRHIPVDLLEIPGGTELCPSGTTQLPDGACQISTVVDITQSRTGFTPGTLTLTPSYFNFIKDPELNADGTLGPICLTEADGCFVYIWLGVAPAPPTTVTVSGTTPSPTLSPAVTVSPASWDLRWDTLGATGLVDLYLGNLTGPCPTGATCTVEKIVASQVRLNGTVAPSFSEILTSVTGFTGHVLHLRYPQKEAMASLRVLTSQTLVAGQQVPLLLTGLLTSDGQATGATVALVRATPTVTLALKTPTALLNELIAKVNGLANVSSATKNSLVVKLQDAKTFLSQANTAGACTKVQDFINLAIAQAGKKQLTVAQANDLRADGLFIKKVLGCP